MTEVRLTRIGKRGRPNYRVIAIDKRKKRDSSPIEVLGAYTPAFTKNSEPKVKIDKARVAYWQSQGAHISPAVQKLLTA